jgi:diketogulonate reductase-like aldo/keto reductase
MAEFTFELYDGSKIPFLAFGTGSALFKQDATKPVATAISKGLIHLDGAKVRILYQRFPKIH